MRSRTWTIPEAKAKFDELIERTSSERPQIIVRNRRKVAIVVAVTEWERKTTRAGNLAEFFAASPLRRSGPRIRRIQHQPRKVDL
ncbi:MAG: type II toxin-antitoxin system Phd/YefM family antitoxin [Xanthobacteraceae bacterium]|nr:type II toxin-antitoxin system Phd/YefM family antitoxin [Xanthobacteraceae bacterium]